jgi:prevent-host-death family protein
MQVNILEAKNRLSQLIKSAQAGEEVVIANRGKPVVRLQTLDTESSKKPERGSAEAILQCLEAHPLPKYARRSAKEIEAAIRAERESWD